MEKRKICSELKMRMSEKSAFSEVLSEVYMKKYACVKSFSFFAASFFLCTVLFSCGKTSSGGKAAEKAEAFYSNSAPVPRTAKMMAAADSAVYANMANVLPRVGPEGYVVAGRSTTAFCPEGPTGPAGSGADFSSGEPAFSDSPSDLQDRKLVKTGSVTLEVESLSAADSAIEKWCASFGGYISDSSSWQTNANYTVKIPSGRFDDAMKTAGNLGILREHSISTQDVTEQFYDLQTRLSNKKVMRDNLRKYLSQAKDVKDMLQIEKELNSVISDIEFMEGRMKRLSNQIDYSTISVSVQLPYGKTETGFSFPDAGEGTRKFISNTVSFFLLCITSLFYVIVCGIPVLAVLGFLFWLLWGKIGLLKKLYRWLSK